MGTCWNPDVLSELRDILCSSPNIESALSEFHEKHSYRAVPKEFHKFSSFLQVDGGEMLSSIADCLRTTLLKELERASQEKLLELLQKCFPFILVPEFQDIAVGVLESLERIPGSYLDFISEVPEVRKVLRRSSILQLYAHKPPLMIEVLDESISSAILLYNGYYTHSGGKLVLDATRRESTELAAFLDSIFATLNGSSNLFMSFSMGILKKYSDTHDHRLIPLLLDFLVVFGEQIKDVSIQRTAALIDKCISRQTISDDALRAFLPLLERSNGHVARVILFLASERSFHSEVVRELYKSIAFEVKRGRHPQEEPRVKALTVLAKETLNFFSSLIGQHSHSTRMWWALDASGHDARDVELKNEDILKFYYVLATHISYVSSGNEELTDVEFELVDMAKMDTLVMKLLEPHIIAMVAGGAVSATKSLLRCNIISNLGHPSFELSNALKCFCAEEVSAQDVFLIMNVLEPLFRMNPRDLEHLGVLLEMLEGVQAYISKPNLSFYVQNLEAMYTEMKAKDQLDAGIGERLRHLIEGENKT